MTDKEGAVIMRPVAVEFTKKDADAAKIYENGQQVPLSAKWNFVSWPEDMYFWRCIGRLKKRHAANVLRGAGRRRKRTMWKRKGSLPRLSVTARDREECA